MTLLRHSATGVHRLLSLLPGGQRVVIAKKEIAFLGSTFAQISKRPISYAATKMNTPNSKNTPEDAEDTIFEVVNGKGIITLNRPRALNALNLSMARKIFKTLREWESSNVQFVMIKGAGI